MHVHSLYLDNLSHKNNFHYSVNMFRETFLNPPIEIRNEKGKSVKALQRIINPSKFREQLLSDERVFDIGICMICLSYNNSYDVQIQIHAFHTGTHLSSCASCFMLYAPSRLFPKSMIIIIRV